MGSETGFKSAKGMAKRRLENNANKWMRNEGRTQSQPIANGGRFGASGGKGCSLIQYFDPCITNSLKTPYTQRVRRNIDAKISIGIKGFEEVRLRNRFPSRWPGRG